MARNLWKMIKHSGRLSTFTTPEMIAKVREVILEDKGQTIHDVYNSIGLSYRSCQCILAEELHETNCSKVCSSSLEQ